jgi:hypothetical protein
MAIDPRKRQKKLERRKAKQKAERRELARRQSRGLPARLREASTAPILHCSISDEIWHEGIGQVLVSRQLKNGAVAFAVFLVDIYCLGVKDVFTDIVPRASYDLKIYNKIVRQSALKSAPPERACKLVEGAVRYASALGLPPHPDYATAELIFGDVAAEACAEEFAYGKDGKPFFFAGPNDDSYKCQQILRTLEKHCGPGGYTYVIPVEEPSLDEWEILDEA